MTGHQRETNGRLDVSRGEDSFRKAKRWVNKLSENARQSVRREHVHLTRQWLSLLPLLTRQRRRISSDASRVFVYLLFVC